MLICIGGVCVPYTAVVPIVILALKWMLDKLGLAAYLPQFIQDLLQVKGIPSPSEKSIETTTEEEFATSAAGPSKVQPLESVEELEELLQNKKVKVVCKFTSTWCVPCKKVQPFFEQCSGQPQYQKKKDGSNVFFRTVDVDEFDELASKYKISMMPTFVVLQGDKILGTYSGSNEHELGTFLKEHAAAKAAKDISLKAFREDAEESSKDIDLKEAKEESSKYEEEPVPVLDDENDDGHKDEAELKEKSAPALSDEAQEAVRDDDMGKTEESIPVADSADKPEEVSKEAVTEEVETPAPIITEKEEKTEPIASKLEDPREKDAEEVPKSEAAMRQNMIETELNAMIDEMMKSEDFEEEDEMEKESYDALMKAAKEICYTRKYYDVSSDKIIYFPSIIKTIVNMDLFEKAETYYFEEEDEFPMLYSMGLRQIAFDKMDAEGGGDEENEELDDDMMERLSMAVQLTETDMDELREALAAAEAEDALDTIDESEDVSNSVLDEKPAEVSNEAVTEEVETPAQMTIEKEEKVEPIATTTPSAISYEETRDPLIFPSFLEPPTGTKLSMPFAPFRKEDEGKDYSDLKAKTTEASATKPAVTKAPPAKDTNVKENQSKTAPAKAETARNPLLFPSFLAPPTGTTLSMPFAPFRKEDEGKDGGGLKAKKASTAANTNKPTSTEEELNSQIAELGEQIKKAKQEKKPKEEWDPILKEMLALKQFEFKAKFKEVTGRDHGAAPKEEKKEKNSGQQEASDKNKEKRAAKAAAKAKKEAEKASKRAERERREREKAEKLTGVGQDNFGDVQMVQSQEITDKKYTEVANLKPSLAGHKVVIRGYLQVSRGVGKGVFVLIRSTLYTVQAVAFQNDTVSQGMVKYVTGLPVESVVEVEGIVTVPNSPVESATQKMVEIQITAFRCVSKAKQALPFLMEDACRPDDRKETDVGAYDENEEVQRDDGLVRVGDKNRLDNRWLDLRTPANQSIMRIESMVGCLFRECLLSKGFVEIHTPKLIAGASEGGADVFTLDYFGQPACLAMSPQLHKQMAAACSGFERVFTTGPVFRAENSNTRRHLCEFTGFDMEMAIHEHYDEVMDVFSDLFIHIFDGLNARCKEELERIREQHPFEDLKYLRPTLKLTYAEGCALLREAGIEQDDYEDLSTENEKKLGDIVKEKYDTDFFFMDKYPLSVRPFYTMPCPENPKLSNSYDFFIRGQEILSGAQRIHDPDLLEERAKEWGIDVSTIAEYVNSFKNGALPHGGGGIGLERVVMLFLGLPNIRKAAWFPRDPRRLRP